VTILAFVPARGGSQGIPRKNLALLAGRPLITYTLDTVRQLSDLVLPFVSTDDDQVAAVCAAEGFPTDYRRSASLATDTSSIVDAVLEAREWLAATTRTTISGILILQPTSPLRNTTELRAAIDRFSSEQIASLVSVVPMREHPYECVEAADTSSWTYVVKPPADNLQRQAYKRKFYFIDGSFYLATPQFLDQHGSVLVEDETQLFISGQRMAVDINEPEDLRLADCVLRAIREV